jgi:sterol desaturase/sphingolipid hydroxylase (fatty acid hydroxylase superfamily)
MLNVESEAALRLGSFFGVFAVMALWELAAPRRVLRASKPLRWTNNLAITFLNSFLLRLVFPVAAIGTALAASERGWGLLNVAGLPWPIEAVIAVMVLDLAIYAQHVVFHLAPPLWRLHRMHHTDLDLDVTSGARFHPVEILLSMVIKMGVVVAIGASALSVLVFEILLNAMAMFNHSNVYMPPAVDRVLRLFIVTPDFHRVHHSVLIKETNSNYGFNFSFWDRLFGTYRAQPAKGHEDMMIGLANYQDLRWLALHWMLAVPLMRKER